MRVEKARWTSRSPRQKHPAPPQQLCTKDGVAVAVLEAPFDFIPGADGLRLRSLCGDSSGLSANQGCYRPAGAGKHGHSTNEVEESSNDSEPCREEI